MGYWLEDNPPIRSQFADRPNGVRPTLVVVHTSEQPADLVAPDNGTEALARFIQQRPTAGCYHTAVDSDSTINLVDPIKQCWGARGVNEIALHISHCTRAKDWSTLPADWVTETLTRSAATVAEWCRQFTIPARFVDPADGVPGITSHAAVDPGRRTDPGQSFPWDRWLTMINDNLNVGPYGPLNAPIVAVAANYTTGGYWAVGADGGVFAVNTPFHGSAGAVGLVSPAVAIVPTITNGGYWIVAQDGGLFCFGDAPYPPGHANWFNTAHRGPVIDGARITQQLILIESNGTEHRFTI